MKKNAASADDQKILHYLATHQADHHNDNTRIQRRGLITAKLSNEMRSSLQQNNGSMMTPRRNNTSSAAIVTRLKVYLHIDVS